MKKRLLSLALALALCLGLTVPALAADTSGLDAGGAKAFYSKLTAYQQAVIYADLRDMNGDKTPELVVVSSPRPDGNGFQYHVVTVDIWQVKNGSAVKTSSVECEAGTFTDMEYVSLSGAIYVHASTNSGRPGFHGVTDTYISADSWEYLGACWYEEPASMDTDAIADEINSTDFFRAVSGVQQKEITREEYKERIQKYRGATVGEYMFGCGGQSWYNDDKLVNGHDATYQDVLKQLAFQASQGSTTTPAPGTFGPYSIYVDGWAKYFIDFESAKVERKTVKVRTVGMGGELRDYENVDAILIKVAPLSRVSTRLIDDPDGLYADFAEYAGCDGAYGWSADVDGSDKFTVYARGSAEFWLYSGAIERSITGKDECIDLDWTMDSAGNYVQAFVLLESGTGTTAPSEPTAPSFTDVPAGEYYAAPVSWAISKGITNGTSTTTFSPDDKCTEAQILTFLWRASGKPAPSGQRPAWVDAAYQDAVLWASNKGMIDLAGFNPGKPCTRANAVKFIWQAQGSPSPSAASTFTDVAKGADYAAAVSWAVEENVTKGTSTTTFSPGDTCTRGQIVTFLHRAMG